MNYDPTRTQFSSTVITVAELNQTVSHLLERSIPLCWISGEISNFTRATSGHWYFTLKDAQAQVRAVMFKNRAIGLDFVPREGEKIEVRATVTLYAPRGDYQLNVENIRRAGLGNLYEAFLQLKQKLSQAGLFDPERKQLLPSFATCIGIITSPQAAALRDILITLQRRAPHVRIIIYPTPVQGAGSAQKIAEMIALASSRNECDVLILSRGGGSIEDLWSFNDEQVALAMSTCDIPIISGVGHETDFTIADFVADVRAPTPTAAAEIAVASRADLLQQLDSAANQFQRSYRRYLDQENQTLDQLSRRLVSPVSYLRSEHAKLDGLQLRLVHIVDKTRKQAFFQVEQLKQKLRNQSPRVDLKKSQLQQLTVQLQQATHKNGDSSRQQLRHLQSQLELLNPQRTLERGYAIIMDQKGTVIRKASQFQVPSHINVKLAEGDVELGIASMQHKLT